MMMEISYPTYFELRKELLQKLDTTFPYDGIISITNGGNILASDISQHLNLPIYYLNPQDFDMINIPFNYFLLVDEIIDSGQTMTELQTTLMEYNFDTAVLYTKIPALCTYFAESIPINHPYIKFPWEYK